jgi:hypothetical protein
MLKRGPGTDRTSRRRHARERQRAKYWRDKAGEGSTRIKYPSGLVDMLCGMGWLALDRVDDTIAIAGAFED